MRYRDLGSTGIRISELAFGAGPVSGLMTDAPFERQCAVVKRAVAAGVNWFDTAPGYGQGRSEENLGRVLKHVGSPAPLHIATKVRLVAEQLSDIRSAVHESVRASLGRLGVPVITLLQLHNSVTARRGEEPTSLTPEDVLGAGGVLQAFREVQAEGLVQHLGLTGIGTAGALRAVISTGGFAAIQVPYHILNPSAGRCMPAGFRETNYDNLMGDCAEQRMGVLAIRVFAAGALLGQTPSQHTKKTQFFPLSLYERDVDRAHRLGEAQAWQMPMQELALRYVYRHPDVTSAVVGFGDVSHLDSALNACERGPLPPALLAELELFLANLWCS